MTTPSALEQETAFQKQLEGFYSSPDTDLSALQKFKTKAWKKFLTEGLPDRSNEVYRYVPLRLLYKQSFSTIPTQLPSHDQILPHVYPECTKSFLVFVNGIYQPTLSNRDALPERLVISTLPDAGRTYSTLLNNQWTKSLKEETDAFATLNSALHQDGAFIYLPPKTDVEQPIQIIHLIDSKDSAPFVVPRIHMFIGAHSNVSLVTSTIANTPLSYCFNQTVEMSIEENAHVRYTQMVYDSQPTSWHFDALRASLKKNSTLQALYMTNGSATVRHDYRIALTGENAEASLNGLWMLSDKTEAHTHVLMDHQAPGCRSRQMYKGVLNDLSRSSFEGKILVQQAAQKTDAFQLNNNLLMSDYAHAAVKPNLEIFADDVKASHGATTGQLDKEQLFYMNTRGFSDAAAKSMLVYSFCQEMIEMLPIPSVLNLMKQYARRTKE